LRGPAANRAFRQKNPEALPPAVFRLVQGRFPAFFFPAPGNGPKSGKFSLACFSGLDSGPRAAAETQSGTRLKNRITEESRNISSRTSPFPRADRPGAADLSAGVYLSGARFFAFQGTASIFP
jgi:hypothetical protein